VWGKAGRATTATDPANLAQWQPGDVVFYIRKTADHPWHVAIVSDRKAQDGMPLIIDGYPPCTSEAHRLDEWAPIHSHFRYEPAPAVKKQPSMRENKEADNRSK
jgi:uncharacterized protein YijF (DUF1287 family)